jgi:hypothetical protein
VFGLCKIFLSLSLSVYTLSWVFPEKSKKQRQQQTCDSIFEIAKCWHRVNKNIQLFLGRVYVTHTNITFTENKVSAFLNLYFVSEIEKGRYSDFEQMLNDACLCRMGNFNDWTLIVNGLDCNCEDLIFDRVSFFIRDAEKNLIIQCYRSDFIWSFISMKKNYILFSNQMGICE